MPGHLLEMFGHVFVCCSDWGKLLAHSERSPGMLSSQQGMGRYAQASARLSVASPLRNTASLELALQFCLTKLALAFGEVVYPGFLQRVSDLRH